MTLWIDPKKREEGQKRHEMLVGLYGPDYAKRDDYLELHRKHFPERWSPGQVRRWITGPQGEAARRGSPPVPPPNTGGGFPGVPPGTTRPPVSPPGGAKPGNWPTSYATAPSVNGQ